MDNIINNKIIKLLNLIKILIKIFYDFIPSLEIILTNNKLLLDNIINLIKENNDINLIISNINNLISNDNNELNLYNLFDIYKNINFLDNIISIYIYYINFDIFGDIKLDISNTLKTNININKNNILLEYNKYIDKFIIFNDEFINFTSNFVTSNFNNLNNKLVFDKLTDFYNKSFFMINLDKDNYLNDKDNKYKYIDILDISYSYENYKVTNLVINLYIKVLNLMNENEYINNINESNKNNLFNFYNNNINNYKKQIDNKNYDKIKYNYLQNFNFKPYALYNSNNLLKLDLFNIYDLVNTLFNIKSKKINDIIKSKKINKDNLFNELNNIIKFYSNKKKENYAFIIIKKNGNLINYDINNLTNNGLIINNLSGINNIFLEKNNMINIINYFNDNDDFIYLINYNKELTQKLVLLDTTNFINYRILTNKNIVKIIDNNIEKDININYIYINNSDIYNLLNKIKSIRITNFNKIMEKKIINNINDTSIDDFYNSINTNFNIYDDDTIYIKLSNNLYNNIMLYITKSIKNNNNKNINKLLFISTILFDNNKIIDIFSNTLYDFYFSLSNEKLLSDESYITYLSNVDYIINKFKKDIFDNYNSIKIDVHIDENIENIISNIIKISINNIINTKTHIYDNMIEKVQLLVAFKN